MFAFLLAACAASGCDQSLSATPSWPLHVIDDSLAGADGVKTADVNRDGFADLVAPYEFGGEVRVYMNPGAGRGAWPRVSVGRVPGPEDAVAADLDGDGAYDVVISTEGTDVAGGNGIFVHWAPASPADYLNESRWETAKLPASEGIDWIQASVLDADARHGPDLVAGSIGDPATIVLLVAPERPRSAADWKSHTIYTGGKTVMSVDRHDFDRDGDDDVFVTMRGLKEHEPGVLWLENPGPERATTMAWTVHPIGPASMGAGFGDVCDLDADGIADVVVPSDRRILWFRPLAANALEWKSVELAVLDQPGSIKAVAVADIDGDRRGDIVLTRSRDDWPEALAALLWPRRWAVGWLGRRDPAATAYREVHDVSGPSGVKFDRMVLADLDMDGDLDIATTEEEARGGQGLGVVWYENPLRGP